MSQVNETALNAQCQSRSGRKRLAERPFMIEFEKGQGTTCCGSTDARILGCDSSVTDAQRSPLSSPIRTAISIPGKDHCHQIGFESNRIQSPTTDATRV